MSEIEAVILAGGQSRRMGRDKALLPFGAYSTLAEYQYRRLQPLFDRVSLSAKERKFPFDAPVIPDQSPEISPMIALASILGRSRADGVFLLGVDMPFVPEEIIEALKEAFDRSPDAAIVAAGNPEGIEPLCAIYRPQILPRVERLLERKIHRLHTLLDEMNTLKIVREDPRAFANLNRPEEYEEAKRSGGSSPPF